MSINPNDLIDKFANLLEQGETLDSSAFADKAVEIIAMISVAPNLGETLQKINAKLYSIIQTPQDIKDKAMETGLNSKACAARELRSLKMGSHADTLH